MPASGPVRKLFEQTFSSTPTLLARAPGRIEVIGNHTDYNGGTVLGAAIDRSVDVAFRPRTDSVILLVSDILREVVRIDGQVVPQKGDASWANYPLGVLMALEKRGLKRDHGFELAVTSDVPTGSGLSSSAALELSSALVLCAHFGLELNRRELAMACQEAENDFVGMPCGILDQGVSAFGEKDQLVHIDCRGPDFSTVPMPPNVHFWIFNTHQKHALVESLYSTRHGECMEATAAFKSHDPQIECLADVSPDRLGPVIDQLPEDVGKRARHVVEEIDRVRQASESFSSGDLDGAGRLLFRSHESSRLLFENSTVELDDLIERLKDQPGVYGARLTGGGFGGAVMAMTDGSFTMEQALEICRQYEERFGEKADALHVRTADGAALR